MVFTPDNEYVEYVSNLLGPPWLFMKFFSLGSFNSLLGIGNLSILWKIIGLKLIGSKVLSRTRIILLVVSKCFEHHKNNFGTLKNSGMHSTFTNPIILRCLEDVSFAGRSEYQLCALDQWIDLSVFTKELNVSPRNGFFFLAHYLSNTNTGVINGMGSLNSYKYLDLHG